MGLEVLEAMKSNDLDNAVSRDHKIANEEMAK